MLEDMLKVNVSGHFNGLSPTVTDRPNPLDYLMVWILRGRAWLETGGQRLTGAAGDLWMLEPGVPQRYGAVEGDDWEWLWVHFSGKAAAVFADAIRSHGGTQIALGFDDRIRDRFLELVIASPGPMVGQVGGDGPDSILADTCLYSLLGLIVDRLDRRRHHDRSHDTDRFNVAQTQHYIHDHLTEPITLDELAEQAALSESHFCRLFKDRLGVSPMRYVIEKRMDRAATLLSQTSMKLAAVSRAVGYDDPYYFSRLFKKVTGVSPSQYRKRSGED